MISHLKWQINAEISRHNFTHDIIIIIIIIIINIIITITITNLLSSALLLILSIFDHVTLKKLYLCCYLQCHIKLYHIGKGKT